MIRTIYFLFILVGCSSSKQTGIETITAEKLRELKEEGVLVIDIRTENEYSQGHIPGVASIDFFSNSFLEEMKKNDLEKPIIIHCASGGRSGKAAKMLKEAGFVMIYDYTGGFADWKSKGLEIEQ